MDPSRTNTNKVNHNKMVKEQLENLGKDALIDIVLTSDRTANNWEEIAEIRENEIDRLEEKIITLNEIEQDQLIKISKLRSELQKIASNLEISQRFTKNVISNSY